MVGASRRGDHTRAAAPGTAGLPALRSTAVSPSHPQLLTGLPAPTPISRKERRIAREGLFAIILWEKLKCKLLRGIHLRERGQKDPVEWGQPKCMVANLGAGGRRWEDWPQTAGWPMALSEQEGRGRSAAGTWLVGPALGIGEGFWPLPWQSACGLQDKGHQRLRASGDTSG